LALFVLLKSYCQIILNLSNFYIDSYIATASIQYVVNLTKTMELNSLT